MNRLQNTFLLLFRSGIGLVFFAHGWQKIAVNGLDSTSAGFARMGVPFPTPSAYFAAFVEVIGGTLLILGLLTSIVSGLLVIVALGALFITHIEEGLVGGYELVLVLALSCALLAVFGSGQFSLDRLCTKSTTLARRRSARNIAAR